MEVKPRLYDLDFTYDIDFGSRRFGKFPNNSIQALCPLSIKLKSFQVPLLLKCKIIVHIQAYMSF